MTRSPRRYRVGFAIVSGLVAIFGIVSTGVASGAVADSEQTAVDPDGHAGNEWCC